MYNGLVFWHIDKKKADKVLCRCLGITERGVAFVADSRGVIKSAPIDELQIFDDDADEHTLDSFEELIKDDTANW